MPFPLPRRPVLLIFPLQFLPGKPSFQGFISFLHHRPKCSPGLCRTSLCTENVNPTGPRGPLCTTGLPRCSLELALDVVGSLAPSLCSGCSFCLEYLPTTARGGILCPGAGQCHLCSGGFPGSSALVQSLAQSWCWLSAYRRERTMNFYSWLCWSLQPGQVTLPLGTLVSYFYHGELGEMV